MIASFIQNLPIDVFALFLNNGLILDYKGPILDGIDLAREYTVLFSLGWFKNNGWNWNN